MKALAEYLIRAKLTQTEFAKRIGVTQAMVSNLVNGVHSASAAVLKRISRETGLSIDKLLADKAASRSDHVA